MFGYIRPYVPMLRIKDNAVYGAIYCGLCSSLDNCYGKAASASLSYDVTFLAAVRLAVAGKPFVISKKKCRFNPFKSCKIASGSEELDFCAAVGVLLTYYKLLDNVSDERGIRSLLARIAMLSVSGKRKKAISVYGNELDDIISSHLNKLGEMEKARIPSIDAPSNVFGSMLRLVASYGYDTEKAAILGAVGEAVGKWIYITDAIDDCPSDAQTGSYNPIIALYGRLPEKCELRSLSETQNALLDRITAAIDLIDFDIGGSFDHDDESVTSAFGAELLAIIENTVSLGMPKASERITKDNPDKQTL